MPERDGLRPGWALRAGRAPARRSARWASSPTTPGVVAQPARRAPPGGADAKGLRAPAGEPMGPQLQPHRALSPRPPVHRRRRPGKQLPDGRPAGDQAVHCARLGQHHRQCPRLPRPHPRQPHEVHRDRSAHQYRHIEHDLGLFRCHRGRQLQRRPPGPGRTSSSRCSTATGPRATPGGCRPDPRGPPLLAGGDVRHSPRRMAGRIQTL